MSFNRLSYDNCSYKQELTESVSYLSYLLDPVKFNNCNKCRPELGIVGGTNVSTPIGNLVDLENNLFGIDRPQTHCPSYKYLPSQNEYVQGKEYIKPVCHPKINTEASKHLQSCQFYDTLQVPQPYALDLYKCPVSK
jgi:hypothetical protein